MSFSSTPTLNPAQAKILAEIEAIARFLDGAFTLPFGGQSIGFDAIVGLLPVGGDGLTAIVGGYIIVRAGMMGIPGKKLLWMVINLAIDTVVGSVPVAGDVFDVYWKANVRNVNLVRSHFGLEPFQPTQANAKDEIQRPS
jgi:hypothetical protein